MNNKVNGKKIAVSIFLIAFTFGLNITGIAPILGILSQEYAARGTAAVQLLQTLPYALLMAGSLVIGWLASRFSKKRIAETGLLIIGICGIFPFFLDTYPALVVSRFLIGFGFGITAPMNTAIAAEFFPPQQRAGYMGLHVVGMGVGTMAGNLIGGLLTGFGYQFFYLIYGFSFLSLLGVALLLPKTAPSKADAQKGGKLNSKVWLISMASFVHTLFITAYSTNIGIYVAQKITDDPAATGVITAVNAAFALMVGATFAWISKFLGKWTLPASIGAAGVGYLSILFFPGMIGVYVGSACCGISLSCFMAQCSYLISLSVAPEAVAKASGIFSLIGGIGGFVCPMLLGMMSEGIMGDNSPVSQFVISGAGMFALAAVVFAACVLSGRRAEKQYPAEV